MSAAVRFSLFLVLLPLAPVLAQGYSEVDLVRGYYRTYLGREPDRAEMRGYVAMLQRGGNPAAVRALFLASDEYFRRQGNNTVQWLTSVLTDAMGRPPSPGDLEYWRLVSITGSGLGYDQRLALARKILRLDPSGVPPPPPPPVQATPPVVLATQMTTRARLFAELVNQDLAGTRQGALLQSFASALISASQQFERTLLANSLPAQQRQAFVLLEAAYAPAMRALNNPPGTAPDAAPVAGQMEQIMNALRRQGFSAPVAALLLDQGLIQPVRAELMALTAQLLTDNQQLSQSAWLGQRRFPEFCAPLLRSSDGLGSHLTALQAQLNVSNAVAELRRIFRRILTQSDLLTQQIGNCPVPEIAQTWLRMQQRINRMSALLGQTGLLAGTEGPILTNPPAFEGLPVPPYVPPPPPPLTGQVVALADALINLIDRALATLQGPVLLQSEMARLLAVAREVRAELVQLRFLAAGGASRAALREAFEQVHADFQRMRDEAGAGQRANPSFSPASFEQLGPSMEQLHRLLR